jgi:triosephosphate isomerase
MTTAPAINPLIVIVKGPKAKISWLVGSGAKRKNCKNAMIAKKIKGVFILLATYFNGTFEI